MYPTLQLKETVRNDTDKKQRNIKTWKCWIFLCGLNDNLLLGIQSILLPVMDGIRRSS